MTRSSTPSGDALDHFFRSIRHSTKSRLTSKPRGHHVPVGAGNPLLSFVVAGEPLPISFDHLPGRVAREDPRYRHAVDAREEMHRWREKISDSCEAVMSALSDDPDDFPIITTPINLDLTFTFEKTWTNPDEPGCVLPVSPHDRRFGLGQSNLDDLVSCVTAGLAMGLIWDASLVCGITARKVVGDISGVRIAIYRA